MNIPILRVEELSHRYTRSWAVRHIDFTTPRHGILGLLGSNGAGKSTTMNIICGALQQTEGKVYVDGIDMQEHPREAKKKLGFLPQQAPLHLDLTVDEYLVHCAHLRLLPKHNVRAAVAAVKERCGIAHFSKRLIRNLSGGYRQRTGLAQAIIHQPKLVVLDEPTNGLDPVQILEVRNLIREIAAERFVIFSSHILSEVQAICQDVIMIEGGRMVFSGTMDDFNNYIPATSMLVTVDHPAKEQAWMELPGIRSMQLLHGRTYRVHFTGSTDITSRVIEAGVANHWGIREITLEKSSLEEVFALLSQKALSTTVS